MTPSLDVITRTLAKLDGTALARLPLRLDTPAGQRIFEALLSEAVPALDDDYIGVLVATALALGFAGQVDNAARCHAQLAEPVARLRVDDTTEIARWRRMLESSGQRFNGRALVPHSGKGCRLGRRHVAAFADLLDRERSRHAWHADVPRQLAGAAMGEFVQRAQFGKPL